MKRFLYYTPLILQKLMCLFFYIPYKFFIKFEIKGKLNLKNIKGPIILAPNHTSELDPTIMPSVLGFFSSLLPIYSVIYPVEKYDTKDFGWRRFLYKKNWFFKLLGGYSVYSGNKDYSKALKDHVDLLQQRKTVCIFPEGFITRDGTIQPARGGIGYLVYKTRAKIIPISINTFFNISPKDFLLRKKKVTITIGTPIRANHIATKKNPSVDDYKQTAQKVVDEIQKLFNK